MKSIKIVWTLLILLICNLALSAAIPAAERQALIDLYNLTGGASWTNKANWLGAAGTENTWYGITTNAGNTTVLAIVLSGNNLRGPLPSSLGNLSNLQYLYLDSNQLTGSIPTELGNLNSLIILSLYSNLLSGSLPTALGNLSNLQDFWLDSNQLTGSIPTEFGNLNRVQELWLNSNQLTGSLPTALGNLSNLTTLSLDSNQFTGSIPANLGNLSKLQYLYLFSNQLTGSIPAELGNLNLLQDLWLDSNQLTGSIPTELGNLSNLLTLSLYYNQLTGSIPSSLGSLSKLQALYLDSNRLTGSIPTSLTNLTALDSAYTDIGYNALHTSDAGLISFLSLKDQDWATTQTISPTGISAVPGSSSVIVSWTPITYTGNTGGYRILVGTTSGGPYTFSTQTANKSVSSQLVTGLTPGVPYYFVVQTRTDAHSNNDNVVDSENSGEVSAVPVAIATIMMTSPNGGESWISSSTHNITWTTTGTVANVKLEYSINGTDWTTIIASTPNTNSYAWTLPAVYSTNCLVRVSEAATGIPTDVGNAVFSIVAPPILTLTLPNGGESWTGGSTHNISWTTTGTVANVKLEYSTNNGAHWTTIITSTANTNSYAWILPVVVSANCLVRVSEAATGTPTDVGNAVFSIVASPGLTVTSPNGRKSWIGGSIHDITWTTTGTVVNIKLEYSLNNGTAWTTIIASTANTNSYSWTLPVVDSANCLVRVSEAATGIPTDVSDSAFGIIVAQVPTIGLSKTSFNFGTERYGTPTPAESTVITNTGTGTLSWTATPSEDWISVLPGSGTGSGVLTISISRTDMSPGYYTGTISMTDPNASNSPQTINVGLNVKSVGNDSPPFGDYATPLDGSTVASSIPVTGWVLDDICVLSVKIYLGTGLSDRAYIGDALFVKGARPDVETSYPGYPQNDRAGWGYMLLTNFLPNGGNGTFQLLAYATDTGGHEALLGSKTIACDNLHAVKPFGAIDTPAQGGTASGSSSVNFGWALTPQPNYIPVDGSTLMVYVDALPLGQPVYNLYRDDIATLFHGYANSNGAVGYYYLNTTAYPNGVHTIAWLVTDSGGNSDGIGSRYFTIQNVAGGSELNGSEAKNIGGTDSLAGKRSNGQKPGESRQNEGLRSAAELAGIPEDRQTPIYIKRGYRDEQPAETIFPETNGSIRIQIPEVSRVVVSLNENAMRESEAERSRYEAYELVLDQLRPLPIGASFDSRNGVFSWQPGPGFLGEYEIVFLRTEAGRGSSRRTLKITIEPKGDSTKWKR